MGGGIHGTHQALVLLDAGVPGDRLVILDPHSRLLARWKEWTSRTGMRYLRSPGVHHIGLAPFDLFRWAGGRRRNPETFRGRVRRPSLEVFNRFSSQVVEGWGLESRHRRGQLTDVRSVQGGLEVHTDRGPLRTRHLLLSTGPEPPAFDEWEWTREGIWPQRVHHLFGPSFPFREIVDRAHRSGRPVAVVGGGISAGHLALRFIGEGCCVTFLSRHPLREHRYDSEPGWLGPRNLRSFWQESCPSRRRRMIREARHRGSVPPALARSLRAASNRGALELLLGVEVIGPASVTRPVISVRSIPVPAEKGERRLLGPDPEPVEPGPPVRGSTPIPPKTSIDQRLQISSLILATGLSSGFGGEPSISGMASRLGLPVGPCGTPLTDRELHWGKGIHVSGPLAEMELGPVARNIVGARMAGERLRQKVEEVSQTRKARG